MKEEKEKNFIYYQKKLSEKEGEFEEVKNRMKTEFKSEFDRIAKEYNKNLLQKKTTI